MTETESLLIVAGEVSGDIHAGNLLDSLRRIRPSIRAFGIGGDRLKEAGFLCIAGIDELAHMGLVEVVRELPRIRRIMQLLVDEAARRKPALAVLVDSPDFNLRLAARLKKLGIPVVLYVSPQLWAWRKGRVRTVRRLVEEVLCVLPFETDFYRTFGVRARYLGHPLVDDFDREGLLDTTVEVRRDRLALLPGSRVMEIRALLPAMLAALRRLTRDLVDDVVLIQAPGTAETVREVTAQSGLDPRVRIVTGKDRRPELAGCALAWTASGTATLECALLDVPMVVGYKMRWLTWMIARLLVKVPHIALVNLIADERAVPELIQKDWNPDTLASVTRELLSGPGLVDQKRALARVRGLLGQPGASRRAAEAIAEHMARVRVSCDSATLYNP